MIPCCGGLLLGQGAGADSCGLILIVAFLLGAGAQSLPHRNQMARILSALSKLAEEKRPPTDELEE